MEQEQQSVASKMVIDLPVLELIKDLQSQHGLKYENYRRYRSYCSRKLHRLRRSLNVHQGIAPSAKARHQRGRKLMDISNQMVIDAGEKNQEYAERMLIIPLCLAERAWSYAMQLKQEISDQPRRRFHLIRRLKKAMEHAQRFEKLCHDPESPCSERTKQESVAYAAYITGLYELECSDWVSSRENLNKALTIYIALSVSIIKDDVLEQYRQRIEELRASLRYCQFNIGVQDSKEITVKLPNQLQFHDIAYRHALLSQNQVNTPEHKKVDDIKAETPQSVPQEIKSDKKAEEEEDDEDEFEETREGLDESEDDESDSDEEDDTQQSRGGGVTGIVKGWLGGAWSK